MIDIKLDSAGDIVYPLQLISGDELTSQRVAIALRTIRGELPYDPTFGLPYDQWFQDKSTTVETINALTTQLINSIPGVALVRNTLAERTTQGAARLVYEVTYATGTVNTVEVNPQLSPINGINLSPGIWVTVNPIGRASL